MLAIRFAVCSRNNEQLTSFVVVDSYTTLSIRCDPGNPTGCETGETHCGREIADTESQEHLEEGASDRDSVRAPSVSALIATAHDVERPCSCRHSRRCQLFPCTSFHTASLQIVPHSPTSSVRGSLVHASLDCSRHSISSTFTCAVLTSPVSARPL